MIRLELDQLGDWETLETYNEREEELICINNEIDKVVNLLNENYQLDTVTRKKDRYVCNIYGETFDNLESFMYKINLDYINFYINDEYEV